jgi:CDP-glycerol glycerophosphotransferase
MTEGKQSGLLRRVRARRELRPFGPAVGGNSLMPRPPSVVRRLSWAVISVANRMVPKKSRQVALHSTIDLEDGVVALIDELATRGHRSVVLLEDPNRAALLRALTSTPIVTVKRRSLRGLLQYLRSPYVVTTENLFGDPPPPGSQVIVNIWHGEPPTKVTGRFAGNGRGFNATYAPVCSTVGRAYRAAEFGMSPLQVPIVGAPRNDRMLRVDAQSVRRSMLGPDAERATFLWLPSFRTGQWGDRQRSDAGHEQHPGVPYPAPEVRALDDWLAQHGARMVVKLHPHDAASFTGDFQAIRVLTQEEMYSKAFTIYTLLPAFDALITDVSSVWVDYLLLDKPLIFAFPDVQEYREGRGLNLEPFEHWVPGPFTKTMQELIDSLADVLEGRDPMKDERSRARVRFHHYRDDRSAARLLDGLGIDRA